MPEIKMTYNTGLKVKILWWEELGWGPRQTWVSAPTSAFSNGEREGLIEEEKSASSSAKQ